LLRWYAIDLDFTVLVENEKWEKYIIDMKKEIVDEVYNVRLINYSNRQIVQHS